jgi:large subunit ribosomal protein L30
MSASEVKQGGTIKVTLVRSTIGKPQRQEDTVRSLGLRKLHQTAVVPDNDATRGMIAKVRHLVEVDEGE